MKSGGGSIAFCSSAVAQHGIPNHEAIAAAKAGVMGELWGYTFLQRCAPAQVTMLEDAPVETIVISRRTRLYHDVVFLSLLLLSAATSAPKRTFV